eukprot:CAMPEP_0197690788 /NCGR_PEP_ID=MMETSP1338-20131121/108828_1 /TAXON_ID=43686 ORGANISM="Pelagodinium beii, Strain RCC1491" /NCGR_SAMPLE_ID=MMETSP1338 /ASSEMBLY_ACC=CAM_ASM_000754 /LENGTH=124 /DNA_ID=CAMNT_0043273273 /DNA_START=104 /DNA_END=475 /DNA_ORIENTATION=+
MPFDWIQTRVEGILHYLKNDFDGFLDHSSKERDPYSYSSSEAKYIFRDAVHSFWHDDPTNSEDIAKYRRRIARFKALKTSGRRILFVRTVARSKELYQTDDLLGEITTFFGGRAHLLIIVDMQR